MGAAVRSARALIGGPMLFVSAAIATAWLLAIGSQWTGEAPLLHHHSLIEGGPPLWIAVLLFLAGWQVMIAAMMLPASLPTIRLVASTIGHRATFLIAFVAVWSAFGLFAFGGDWVLHHVVDATPWLAARPWLIEGGVLGLAGAYQLSSFKRRSLAACRHPVALVAKSSALDIGALDLGIAHGIDCLGSSWALMLLMFAEGFANLWWMAALTALMIYETTSHNGQWVASFTGVILLTLSLGTILSGWAGV
jgi:predicted metal-binding membrane protein